MCLQNNEPCSRPESGTLPPTEMDLDLGASPIPCDKGDRPRVPFLTTPPPPTLYLKIGRAPRGTTDSLELT